MVVLGWTQSYPGAFFEPEPDLPTAGNPGQTNINNVIKDLMKRSQTVLNIATAKLTNRFRSAISGLPAGNSMGITLIETVIALAMFSSAGTAVLMGVGAAHRSGDTVNASAVAENLARNQMEYVTSLPYVAAPGNYASVGDDPSLDLSIPAGFAVSAAAQSYIADDGLPGVIQKVVVTVTRDGQSVLTLESLRTGS